VKNSYQTQKASHKKLTKSGNLTRSICLTHGGVWCLHVVL